MFFVCFCVFTHFWVRVKWVLRATKKSESTMSKISTRHSTVVSGGTVSDNDPPSIFRGCLGRTKQGVPYGFETYVRPLAGNPTMFHAECTFVHRNEPMNGCVGAAIAHNMHDAAETAQQRMVSRMTHFLKM